MEASFCSEQKKKRQVLPHHHACRTCEIPLLAFWRVVVSKWVNPKMGGFSLISLFECYIAQLSIPEKEANRDVQ